MTAHNSREITMSPTKKALKRKTLKLRHPNPLFEKWLQEWRDEAASRHSDTQYAFQKALASLKKYPLPLKTGKECMILDSFGTRICLLLDRKLATHNQNQPLATPDTAAIEPNYNEVNCEPKTTKSRKKADKSIEKPKSFQKSGKSYVPTLRSAPYAVLIALHDHIEKTGPPGEMRKGELQKAAQPWCDTSLFKPLPGSHYSGWSCVGQLLTKGLVCRKGNPHRYSLTEEGISLAEKLTKENEQTKDNQISSCSSVLNNITKKTASQAVSRMASSSLKTHQPVFQLEDNPDYSDECLTQKSTDTLSSQIHEAIFLPGTFKTVLLVDTQEIHKGDELVKALEAQGVLVEVRKIKVGDFAWVCRNEAGIELLLPYIVERKRLDDLASSIKDGRFHEQKFRLKQCGVPNCIYLIESHGQRHYSLPTSTLLQAAANTQFIDNFTVKHTDNSHETVVYLATFTQVVTRKFMDKTLLECKKALLPAFRIEEDCISLMSFKEFNKLSSKTRKYTVKEMFIKQLVQLRGLSVDKALAIVANHPSPQALMTAFANGGDEKLLCNISTGSLNRKIGPVISKTVYELYCKNVFS